MSSLITILLVETCVILFVTLVIMLWLQIKAKGQHKKAVSQLVSQIKQQSKTRTEETGSFLQESYELTDTELTTAVKEIDKQERKFFQKLVDILAHSDTGQITSLDASVAELIDTYKSLKPKPIEIGNSEQAEQDATEIEVLKSNNETLAEELKVTKETMSNMIKEFGCMFGGGKDHELGSDDVVGKVVDPSALVDSSAENETAPTTPEKQPDI